MNAIHNFNGDDWVRVIGILMALTLVLGRGVTRGFRNGFRMPRASWLTLAWMVLVWAAIIAAAALAFQNFRHG